MTNNTYNVQMNATSGVWNPAYEIQMGIKCAYCASLNNATKFDNCRSCGAPLAANHGPDKLKRLWKTS